MPSLVVDRSSLHSLDTIMRACVAIDHMSKVIDTGRLIDRDMTDTSPSSHLDQSHVRANVYTKFGVNPMKSPLAGPQYASEKFP